jgi:hypothetical protein
MHVNKKTVKQIAKDKPRGRMFKVKLKTVAPPKEEKWICYYEEDKVYREPDIVVVPYTYPRNKSVVKKYPNHTLVGAMTDEEAAIKARRQFILRHIPYVGNPTLQKAINNHFEHSVKTVTQAVHDSELIKEINKMALRYCHYVKIEQENPSPTSRTRKVRQKVKIRRVGTLKLSGWFSWYYDLAKKVNHEMLIPSAK